MLTGPQRPSEQKTGCHMLNSVDEPANCFAEIGIELGWSDCVSEGIL